MSQAEPRRGASTFIGRSDELAALVDAVGDALAGKLGLQNRSQLAVWVTEREHDLRHVQSRT